MIASTSRLIPRRIKNKPRFRAELARTLVVPSCCMTWRNLNIAKPKPIRESDVRIQAIRVRSRAIIDLPHASSVRSKANSCVFLGMSLMLEPFSPHHSFPAICKWECASGLVRRSFRFPPGRLITVVSLYCLVRQTRPVKTYSYHYFGHC